MRNLLHSSLILSHYINTQILENPQIMMIIMGNWEASKIMLKFNKSSTNLKFEKINHKLQQYLTNIQKICLVTQTQISTRKETIDSTSLIVSDLTLNANKNIINMINSLIYLLIDLTSLGHTIIRRTTWIN